VVEGSGFRERALRSKGMVEKGESPELIPEKTQ
jgi:hypothetical protein